MKTATQPKFKTYWTCFETGNRHITPSGSGTRKEYGYEVNSKGQKVLVETGEVNQYAEIQSYKDECLIENIMARLRVGDYTAFRVDGIYQDVTKLPNNLIDAKREMVKLENVWNHLTNEQKSHYDFSLETFIHEAGSEAWQKDMGLIQPETTPEIVPEAISQTKAETKVETPATE